MSTSSERKPFLTNFEIKLNSPKMPGVYSRERQVRVNKSDQPVVETNGGILATTRTGEHTHEC